MSKKSRIILALVMLSGLAGGLIKFGKMFFGSGTGLRQSAESGDVDAQLKYGKEALVKGQAQDAIDFLGKAADQGNLEAQTLLGSVYYEGKLVEQDLKQAVEWFREAASKGHVPALIALGILYRDGEGVERSYPEAETYFRLAASTADPKARLVLADLYGRNDFLGDSAKAESLRIYRELAEQGQVNAMLALGGQTYAAGSHKEGCDWFEKAGGKGDSTGAIGVAVCFQTGHGRDKSDAQFHQWLMKAVEARSPEAYFVMGDAYFQGKGVGKDEAEAYRWFEKAADAGDPRALFNVAKRILNGQPSANELRTASSKLKLAAEKGFAPAQYEYAVLIGKGSADAANDSLASFWYQKAADQGYAPAMFNLAVLYIKGSGVDQDLDKARELLNAASAVGYDSAKVLLGKMNEKDFIKKIDTHSHHDGHTHHH